MLICERFSEAKIEQFNQVDNYFPPNSMEKVSKRNILVNFPSHLKKFTFYT